MRKRVNGKSGVYLFKVNGKSYLVSIHFYFYKLLLNKKNFEFVSEEEANRFYDRIAKRIKGPISAER